MADHDPYRPMLVHLFTEEGVEMAEVVESLPDEVVELLVKKALRVAFRRPKWQLHS